MKTDSPHRFGRVLAEMLLDSGFARKNHSPDWIRFTNSVQGVEYETLRKAVVGERPPSPALIEKVARTLNVPPSTFLEYRLISARRELDPAEVGWERASESLIAWEEYIAAAARETID